MIKQASVAAVAALSIGVSEAYAQAVLMPGIDAVANAASKTCPPTGVKYTNETHVSLRNNNDLQTFASKYTAGVEIISQDPAPLYWCVRFTTHSWQDGSLIRTCYEKAFAVGVPLEFSATQQSAQTWCTGGTAGDDIL